MRETELILQPSAQRCQHTEDLLWGWGSVCSFLLLAHLFGAAARARSACDFEKIKLKNTINNNCIKACDSTTHPLTQLSRPHQHHQSLRGEKCAL